MNKATLLIAITLLLTCGGCAYDRATARDEPATASHDGSANLAHRAGTRALHAETLAADPDQYVSPTTHKSGSHQVFKVKRLSTAANGGAEYDVMWGPTDSSEAMLAVDQKDGETSASFEVEAGYAFSYRPMRWPLGRTRRIRGGVQDRTLVASPEVMNVPAGCEDTPLFVVYYRSDSEKIDRMFVMDVDDGADPSCRNIEVTYAVDGRQGTVKPGEYVEVDANDVVTEHDIRTAPIDVRQFLLNVEREAVARRLKWVPPR